MNRYHTLGLVLALALTPLSSAELPDTYKRSIFSPGGGPQLGAGQGFSVAVDGDIVAVGCPFDDVGGSNSGLVKIYNAITGQLLHVIPNPTPASGDNFGNAVALSGSLLVVGAFFDDTGASDAGRAYVFDLATAAPTVPVATLAEPGAVAGNRFGASLSASGSLVIVGAPMNDTGATDCGSAYVYDLASATPLIPKTVLRNPTPSTNEAFGTSVGISANRAVVGAPLDSTGAVAAGIAYAYDLAGPTPTIPMQVVNNPSPALQDNFGTAVAISGTRIVVGVPGDDTGADGAGIAYAFDVSSAAPTTPIATLNNASPGVTEQYGSAVAISGSLVMVGARRDNTGAIGAGIADVYDMTSATPNVPVQSLKNPLPAQNDGFGVSVAIAGNRAVAGASDDDTRATDAGSAYVFNLSGPQPGIPTFTLNVPSPASGDAFAVSAAVSGTLVVIGAPAEDAPFEDSGRAYVFDLAGSDPLQPILVLDSPTPDFNERFGFAVAVAGTRVIVGAYADRVTLGTNGIVYVYDLTRPNPSIPAVTINNPVANTTDFFGYAVAASGTRLVVGAYGNDTGANDAGKVYVYNMAGIVPTTPTHTLNNPSPGAFDQFGISVGISGDRVVVGAPYDDTGGQDSGQAYVYNLTGPNPTTPVATLPNPSPAADDYFGESVAISGSRVAVGAPGDNGGGTAYVYDTAGPNPTTPVSILNNPTETETDSFASSVAISDTRVVVGAWQDDSARNDAGVAYLYDLTSATPTNPAATLHQPNPVGSDFFGHAISIDGSTLVVGASGFDQPVVDKGAAFIFGRSDTVTLPPLLTSPASGSATSASMQLTFTLPEAALAGSVKVTFNDGSTSRVVTLSASQESAGFHSFVMPLLAPTNAQQVAAGGAIPPGVHTITLSYQDALGNPVASASSANVTVDVDRPVLDYPNAVTVRSGVNSNLAAIDITPLASGTDPLGPVVISQDPFAGTLLGFGTHDVIVKATDPVGNRTTAIVKVTVIPGGNDDRVFGRSSGVLIDVLRNDGAGTVIASFTQPSAGTVTLQGTRFRYQPATALPPEGDSFTYTSDYGQVMIVAILPVPAKSSQFAGLLSNWEAHTVFTASRLGGLTGTVSFEGRRYAAYAAIGAEGPARVKLKTGRGGPTIWLAIYVGPNGPAGTELDVRMMRPSATVTTDGVFELTHPADVLSGAARQSPYGPTAHPQQAGQFTLVGHTVNDPNHPLAVPMTGTVSTTGKVRLAGKGADGRAFTAGTVLLAKGDAPIYAGTGSGNVKPLVRGDLTFREPQLPGTEVEGEIEWFAPAGHPQFESGRWMLDVIGARYAPTVSPRTMLVYPPEFDAEFKFVDADGGDTISRKIGTALVQTGPAPLTLLKFNAKSGTFSGQRRASSALSREYFFGVVLQGAEYNYGLGQWNQPSQLGTVTLLPATGQQGAR